MNIGQEKGSFTKKELLKECWSEQRQEITYRRDREQVIFQTSASVWVGLIGAILINGQTASPILHDAGFYVKLLMSFVILLAAAFTHVWIKKQREARIRSQKALTRIQDQCGCFHQDENGLSVLPVDFRDDWDNLPADTHKRRMDNFGELWDWLKRKLTFKDSWKRFKKKGSFKHVWSWGLPIIVIVIIWLPIQKDQSVQDANTKSSTPLNLQKSTP